MGKLTISMAMFNSYAKLPEGATIAGWFRNHGHFHMYIYILVGGLEHVYFPIQLGMIIPIDFHILF